MATIPMIRPDGSGTMVDKDHYQDAIDAKYSVGVAMRRPTGEQTVVPVPNLPDALKSNYKTEMQYQMENDPNTPTMGAASSSPTWLQQAESDLTQGGNRTVLGRTLGALQGRGQQGYTGIESGVSKQAGDFVGSPLLGAIHAAQGLQSTPDHPIMGPLRTLGGVLEASTLPLAFTGGAEAGTVVDMIPSRTHAGDVFNSLRADIGNSPVSLKSSSPYLQQMSTLAKEGGGNLPLPIRQLAMRAGEATPKSKPLLKAMQDELNGVQSVTGPQTTTYNSARNFQEGLTKLSSADTQTLSGSMGGKFEQLKGALYDDLHDAATAVGRGDDYAAAMKEYRQASTMRDTAKAAMKVGLAAGGATGAYQIFEKLIGAK